MILLDTDHLSVYARSEGSAAPALRRRIVDHHRTTNEPFAVTAISLEEQMRGWLGKISRQREPAKQVDSYGRLVELVDFYAKWQIAPFDSAAATRLCELRRAGVRIGTMLTVTDSGGNVCWGILFGRVESAMIGSWSLQPQEVDHGRRNSERFAAP